MLSAEEIGGILVLLLFTLLLAWILAGEKTSL